jgi:hypothetical protein
MADYNQVNDVPNTNINQINDVPYANCAQINDCTSPSLGATQWVAAQDDRHIAFAANSDLTSWTSQDSFSGGSSPNPGSSNDHIHIAYGKDGSGNGRWVASYATNNCELAYSNDPSAQPWTGINEDSSGNNLPNRVFVLQWGNDVWIAAGVMNTEVLYRSTDGAAWAQIDISGATSINGTAIYALAQNGSGTWWFAQENRIYQSTNDGQSWSLLHTLVDSGNADPGNIRALHFTNNTLVAGVDANPGLVFAAASSDLTDWSTETSLTNGSAAFDQQTQSAAAGGRVVAVGNAATKWTMDVAGKSITMDENDVDLSGDDVAHGTAKSISTDGTTWVVTCLTGDVFTSTNGGDSWSAAATNVGSKDMMDNAPDVYLPL